MAEPEASVCIVHTRGPEESILLIRRAERESDSWSGQWSLPGGHRDEGDVDLLHTGLRELEEECGIRLTRDELEGAPLWGFTYRLVSDWLGLPTNDNPAQAILGFLLERGLTLARDWNDGVAEVRGRIPVEDVLARFCGPGPQALSINRLEAEP